MNCATAARRAGVIVVSHRSLRRRRPARAAGDRGQQRHHAARRNREAPASYLATSSNFRGRDHRQDLDGIVTAGTRRPRHLRLHRRGDDRPADLPAAAAGSRPRGGDDPRAAATGERLGTRDGPAAQGRQRDRGLAHGLADPDAPSGAIIGASKIVRDITSGAAEPVAHPRAAGRAGARRAADRRWDRWHPRSPTSSTSR